MPVPPLGVCAEKVTLTVWLDVIKTLQLCPEHAPERPEELEPLSALAVTVTVVWSVNVAVQLLLHVFCEDGDVMVTVPEPDPLI